MNTAIFDGLVQEMGIASTRRGIVRMLGGAMAVGAGLAVAASDESQAKSRGNNSRRGKGAVSAQGKGKKVTVCYQNQTRLVKKSKLGKYPGATQGTCPVANGGGNNNGGNNNGGGNNGGGMQQPVACTNFVLSGGPNQTDPIGIDDDGAIYHREGAKYLVNDNSGNASSINPVIFSGKVGDTLELFARDWGGCRSFSPLWVHCLATGQKNQIFTGYGDGKCTYPAGIFLSTNVTIAL